MNSKTRVVFDASAILALIHDETGAGRLEKVRKDAIASSVSLSEVLAKLVSKGMPQNLAAAAFAALHLEVAPFESDEALKSSDYVAKNVSLGDRCFLACAHKHGTGWTADHDLARISSAVLPPLKMFR